MSVPCLKLEDAPRLILRDYQERWLAKIAEDRKTFSRVLLVAATGTGKTSGFAAIAADEWASGRRTLVLENRDKLVRQTAKRIEDETGLEVGIEMADEHASPFAPVVVASVQTLTRDARLTGFAEDHFGLVVMDECFPAHTRVDARPISTYRVGHKVASFNHAIGKLEIRRVSHVFKKRVRHLVRITLVDGQEIVCTPAHPVYSATQRQYIPAFGLTCDDMVVGIMGYENSTEETDPSYLRQLRHAIPDLFQRTELVRSRREKRVLQRRMPTREDGCDEFGTHGADEQKVRISENDCEKSHGTPRDSGESQNDAPGHGMEADSEEGKRHRADGASATLGLGAGLGNGVCRSNETEAAKRLPNLLQTGHRECSPSGRCRSGRVQPLLTFPPGSGPKKGSVFSLARVDRVEVLQRGSRGGFGEVCPDGFVYNLEVEGNSNYFADGFLVHNCHHSLSKSFAKVASYFHYGAASLDAEWKAPADGTYPVKSHVLGVTATPELGNRKTLWEFYHKLTDQYQYLTAVQDGWLVPPVTKNIPLKIDIRGLRPGRTPNGSDFNAMELSERLVPVLEALAKQIVAEASDRKGIVFVPSIECARLLAAAITRLGLRGIFVSGECLDVDEKTEAFVAAGPGTFLTNACLYVEGADFPDVSCIVPARATKSVGFYKQQIGRGTRTLPGVVDGLETAAERRAAIAASAKPDLLILDPLWISDRIDLCDVYDLFTDKPEVKAAMKKVGPPTPDSAETAERDFLKALEKEARKHARKQARTIDPLAFGLNIGDDAIVNYVPQSAWEMQAPSERQIEFMVKNHIDHSAIKYMGLAHKIIGRFVARRKLCLATPHQLSFLKKLGFDEEKAATMTMADATAAIAERLERWHGGR